MSLDPADVAWSLNHFRMLRVGGVWGVPRSGLVFTKTDHLSLRLTDQMPYTPGLPLTAEELLAYQDDDFNAIAAHFRAAGIEVSR